MNDEVVNKSYEDLRDELDLIVSLKKHAGFDLFLQEIQNEINQLTTRIIAPIESQDEIFKEQYLKGAMMANMKMLGWINQRVTMLNEDIEHENRKKGIEDA